MPLSERVREGTRDRERRNVVRFGFQLNSVGAATFSTLVKIVLAGGGEQDV